MAVLSPLASPQLLPSLQQPLFLHSFISAFMSLPVQQELPSFASHLFLSFPGLIRMRVPQLHNGVVSTDLRIFGLLLGESPRNEDNRHQNEAEAQSLHG